MPKTERIEDSSNSEFIELFRWTLRLPNYLVIASPEGAWGAMGAPLEADEAI